MRTLPRTSPSSDPMSWSSSAVIFIPVAQATRVLASRQVTITTTSVFSFWNMSYLQVSLLCPCERPPLQIHGGASGCAPAMPAGSRGTAGAICTTSPEPVIVLSTIGEPS